MLLFVLLLFVLSNVSSGYDWCPQYHLIRGTKKYDPSGPIYYNNLWHVFEDSCSWCHYYSSDLLHWKQINPTPFSGLTGSITTINNNEFIAFYPKQDQSSIIRAISNDNMLLNWTNTGEVIKKPSIGTKNYRDPLRPLIINGNTYIGVASGIYPNGPAELLWYKSMNNELTEFKLLGSLFNISTTDGCIDSKTVMYFPNASYAIPAMECPDVFLMKNKYIIIAGLFCTNEYWVGDIDINNNIFKPDTNKHALLDYGNFYAAKTGTMADDVNGNDRRVLFGFTGWSEPTAPTTCGRSHVIPRDIQLNDNNMLNINPIKEIVNIRGNTNNIKQGSELQIILNCNITSKILPTNGNISINVLISNDNSEYVQIGYSFGIDTFGNDGYFYIDHRKCCNDNNNIIQTVLFDKQQIINQNGLYFNILLDRSIIESFLNQQKVITAMVNPSNNTSPQNRRIEYNNNFKQDFNCDFQAWQLSL